MDGPYLSNELVDDFGGGESTCLCNPVRNGVDLIQHHHNSLWILPEGKERPRHLRGLSFTITDPDLSDLALQLGQNSEQLASIDASSKANVQSFPVILALEP